MKKLILFLLFTCTIAGATLTELLSVMSADGVAIETNSVAETGVVILSRPVVRVTMEAGHSYTLWHKEKLTDLEWRKTIFLRDYVVGDNPQRITIESSQFDERSLTGFFWLQVDGESITNAPSVITNVVVSAPLPIP